MIKKFNEKGAIALYKREFAECLEKCDYEGAIDILLKFSQARQNPYFHSAMGVLYFLLTQDSEDRELLPLAYREFLMHLITHPDDRYAYRNLLAVAILRHDPSSIAEISEFISARGYDVKSIAGELSEYGLDIFNDDSAYIDLDGLFLPADYGEIADDMVVGIDERDDVSEPPMRRSDEKTPTSKPKVIKFRGGNAGETADRPSPQGGKIIKLKSDEPIEELISPSEMFDMMMELVRGASQGDDSDGDDFLPSTDDRPSDLSAKLALRNAQSYCIRGDYEKALSALDEIDRSTGRLYYCGECVRANIMVDMNMYDEAQKALDRAFEVIPNGALAGTLQCSLYEIAGEFGKIPDALKRIDVADYVDSDHVYKALRFAVKYCTEADALKLIEDYVEEFNSFDLRSVYAQMLYNAGEKDAAIKELRTLSRIQYDDFNAQYYYLMAKAGVDQMPLEDETPQKVLGILVDNMITLVHSDMFTAGTEIIDSEAFTYGLEVFLTLEFRHTRGIVKIMFETLNRLASDERLQTQMRNALVSPYVEDLVKAVILGKLLGAANGKTEFLLEQSFCPITSEVLPKAGEDCGKGFYTAYALTLMSCRKALPFLIEYYAKIRPLVQANEFADRDVAYFLWRAVKAQYKLDNKDFDERMHFALGYETKAQASAAYKAMTAVIPKP
ncbi:MAG: tetratricopeptide repeat protein [Clostridiales bacterium]|nr:tetratricopeptide repeat protein [Clostridiales bacterium]